jgi:hypothetical protein
MTKRRCFRIGVLGATMLTACADIDESSTGAAVDPSGTASSPDGIETVRSPLGGFPIGSWITMGAANFGDNAPALARSPVLFSTLTAFGIMANQLNNGQVFANSQNASGQWAGGWSQLSNNGGIFTKGPSAAAFAVPSSSPLFNKFAIVAMRADAKYYITIRDKTGGGTVLNWTAIPNGTFLSAPAITFVPQASPTGPQRTLVLVGRGGDGKIYEARNTLSADNNYFHQGWTGFFAIQNDTFVEAPAISFACQNASQTNSLIVAAAATFDGDINIFRSTKWDGTSWSPWADLQTGLFRGGPALSTRTGCSDGITETVTFGRGLDDHIWTSTQLSGGSGGWLSIPGANFKASPQAVGTTSTAFVTALQSGGDGRSNKASSP